MRPSERDPTERIKDGVDVGALRGWHGGQGRDEDEHYSEEETMEQVKALPKYTTDDKTYRELDGSQTVSLSEQK
jgi:hypothetical protein